MHFVEIGFPLFRKRISSKMKEFDPLGNKFLTLQCTAIFIRDLVCREENKKSLKCVAGKQNETKNN